MNVHGTKRDILHTIADIQKSLSIQQVEDAQIAEESELNLRMVRQWLQELAEDGYVQLVTSNTLVGPVYDVSLSPKGKEFLKEDHVPV